MSHSLERTSPKGQPFVGTCMKCGLTDVPLNRVHEHCANPANITDDEALIIATGLLDGDKQ